MDILKLQNTQTTYFLVPLLFSKDTKYTQIINKDFRNAYIADLDNKQYDDKILLVYSKYPVGIPAGSRLTEYKNGDNSVLVYNIPDDLKEDYGHFLRGEWSQLTDESKEKILTFWEEGEESLIHGILNKIPNKAVKAFYKKYTDINPVKDAIIDYWYKPNIILEILGG